MLTVQEYADQRGCAPKTVYNALKKHNIQTVEGVSNGKAAQVLPDEAIEQLNQIIRTTPQELTVLKQQLEHRETDYQMALSANREAMQAKDELAHEKDITRVEALEKVSDIEQKFTENLTKLSADFSKSLADKEEELEELRNSLKKSEEEKQQLKAQIKEQTDLLAWSQEHPIKNAWKYIGGHNNESSKGHESASKADS